MAGKTRKSKAALKNALRELTVTRSPQDITVTELCAAAGVNRSTFYDNYGTMEQLLRDIYRDFVTRMYARQIRETTPEETARELMVTYIRYLRENRQRMSRLSQDYNDPLFREVMQEYLLQLYDFRNRPIEEAARFLYNIAGGFAIVMLWLQQDTPGTEEKLAEFLIRQGMELR